MGKNDEKKKYGGGSQKYIRNPGINGTQYNSAAVAKPGIVGTPPQQENVSKPGIVGTPPQNAQITKPGIDGMKYGGTASAETQGIVGTPQKNSAQQQTTPAAPGGQTGAYQPGAAVMQAQAMLEQQLAQKPGEYKSAWQDQLNDTINKILNRESFSYDMDTDAFYRQMQDKYIQQGQQAMADTIGQAAALTGGYANSYAQMAGQQAYNGYLQQLNDQIPELYQMAMDKYRMEGDALNNQLAVLSGQEQQDYGRYRDSVADWNAQQAQLYDRYLAERDFDYSKYADDRNFAYQQGRDEAADRQWQESFDYSKLRDQIGDEQWQKEFDEAMRRYEQEFRYQQDRDSVADDQWQQSFDYGKAQDEEARRQWQESFDYGKERDQMSDQQWQKEFEEAMRRYEQEYGYQQQRDQIADEQWRESFEYGQERDRISDEQWRESFDYGKERDQISDEQWQKQFDEAKRQYDQNYSRSYSIGGGGGGKESAEETEPVDDSYDNGSVSANNIKHIQLALGIEATGKWDKKSREAAGGLSADDAWQQYFKGKLGRPVKQEAPKEKYTFDNIGERVNEYISGGASASEINDFLNAARQAGHISVEEYKSLKAMVSRMVK